MVMGGSWFCFQARSSCTTVLCLLEVGDHSGMERGKSDGCVYLCCISGLRGVGELDETEVHTW
jgi:hypothetical protein